MDICVGIKYKSLLLIAESENDIKRLMEITNQSTREETKRLRTLYFVIEGRLCHALSVEESSF